MLMAPRGESISKAVNNNDYDHGLPKGVAVVCHEVFQNYAACFSHCGLYIPVKRKTNNSQQSDSKRQKMQFEDKSKEEEEDEDSEESSMEE